MTPTAVQVRLNGAAVTRTNVFDLIAHGEHLDAEFVPGNARIRIERHGAEIPAVIASTDSNAVNLHQRFTCRWRRRFSNVNLTELSRLRELNGFHTSRGMVVGKPETEKEKLNADTDKRVKR
jgi:hypothetical protein